MNENDCLAPQFEEHRPQLRAVAYRMLGSLSEAEDAVQETWLRLHRTDSNDIENLGGWLTTVISRICLNVLRSRKTQQEQPLTGPGSSSGEQHLTSRDHASDPETEAVLADSVSLAMLVVLDTLSPSERVAFVLHDVFEAPFEEIAPIVDRTPAATRKLASRARRRVQESPANSTVDLARQREVVDAFLAAARGGDFETLVTLLDPEIVFRSDNDAMFAGAAEGVRGVSAVARLAARSGAVAALPALVDGTAAVVIAPGGRLIMVLKLAFSGKQITGIEAIGDPARLDQLEIALLDPG
jgi:RNA polymerase sigma-70 factor (ECF subfamily)